MVAPPISSRLILTPSGLQYEYSDVCPHTSFYPSLPDRIVNIWPLMKAILSSPCCAHKIIRGPLLCELAEHLTLPLPERHRTLRHTSIRFLQSLQRWGRDASIYPTPRSCSKACSASKQELGLLARTLLRRFGNQAPATFYFLNMSVSIFEWLTTLVAAFLICCPVDVDYQSGGVSPAFFLPLFQVRS